MNRDSYDRISEKWDSSRIAMDDRERRFLDAFLQGLPDGGTIVDGGCGTGRPIAEYLIEKGYQVVGVDQAENQLEKARQRFPEQKWILSPLEEYPFNENCVGVICWDCLFHIPRDQHEPILSRIAMSLPVGGRLMLTSGGSENPPFTDTMLGAEFFYDSHPPEKLLQLLTKLGFAIEVAEFLDLPTDDRDKGRFGIVAKR